jgi:acetolactate synthase-1/2/3 large subunit
VRTLDFAANMGATAAAAVQAAIGPPGQVATLIIPADYSWSEAGEPASGALHNGRAVPSREHIRNIAKTLRENESAGIILGGSALQLPALRAASGIRAATGAKIFANRNSGRMTRGRGVPSAERIPYFPEAAQALLAPYKRLILVESKQPVSFFGYPGLRSTLAAPDCIFETLAEESQDGASALEQLAEELGAPLRTNEPDVAAATLPHGEPLTPATIGRAVAALTPEQAIFSDEAVSSSEPIYVQLAAAAPHDFLPVTGGSIGQGLPVAVGAAIACPDRKVIALEADGSAMYTMQALWTMAREQLDVTVVLLANRRYRILDIEMRRTGAGAIGPRADRMLDLNDPTPDWVKLSEGLGVQAVRAATADEFVREFAEAMRQRGPRLIEAII